jgi:hypothetical protein
MGILLFPKLILHANVNDIAGAPLLHRKLIDATESGHEESLDAPMAATISSTPFKAV